MDSKLVVELGALARLCGEFPQLVTGTDRRTLASTFVEYRRYVDQHAQDADNDLAPLLAVLLREMRRQLREQRAFHRSQGWATAYPRKVEQAR